MPKSSQICIAIPSSLKTHVLSPAGDPNDAPEMASQQRDFYPTKSAVFETVFRGSRMKCDLFSLTKTRKMVQLG